MKEPILIQTEHYKNKESHYIVGSIASSNEVEILTTCVKGKHIDIFEHIEIFLN